MSFFAYAPYQSGVTSSKTDSGIYEWRVSNGANSHKGLKAVYQVGTDVLNHQDLVLAQAVDQTSEDDPVQLKFKHALAKGGGSGGGGDDPTEPEPVDPNPGDGGDPTPDGDGGSITITATVSDWEVLRKCYPNL